MARINSNRKGKVGERELANWLKERGYAEARRGVQYKGGASSPDVVGVPGIHIECKRVEALQLYPALAQARRDAGDAGAIPVVLHRRNDEQWVAILGADDFLTIWQAAKRQRDRDAVLDVRWAELKELF